MVQVTRSFAILSIAALSLAAVIKRDAATVEKDLAVLTGQVMALDNAAQAFPLSGGTLAEAMTVHTSAVNVISTLTNAASDEQAVDTFSETEGQAILAALEGFEPNILDFLQNTVVKKPAFALFPGVTALILQDLNNYLTAGIAFGSTLFNKAPADLDARVAQFRTTTVSAFEVAIDAYSS
ncbi:hydrophobic surface binding protein [Mycena olivaceomarginata]|nr:hydrophobic surface binding protein [Mycena olivaceomarginata]